MLHGSTLGSNWLFYSKYVTVLSSLSTGPRAHASDAVQPIGLLYDFCPTVIFRHSHFRRQVPPRPYAREILAAKGGTVGKNVGR
jgi:hypothetical protein